MEERSSNESEKMEEIMLPGFRFHPTDEELVGFYLKRKIQQRPLSIELIKQLDIYKYDPWDLPKLATTGEKEWYFYCPRDRKYRNSARPNRVTGAGFWKATGTDRPIYSSEGNKCIGLKKSLVFYKGRAAKGVKTDWMMHEFRLPSLTDSSSSISAPPKRFLDKTQLPPNDSWAICRIFKKTNSTAQRALSQSWVSPLIPETSSISELSSETAKASSQSVQFNHNINTTTDNNNNIISSCSSSSAAFSPLDFIPSFKQPPPHQLPSTMSTTSCGDLTSLIFAPLDQTSSSSISSSSSSSSSKVDVTSMLLNMSSSMLGDYQYQSCNNNGFISATSSAAAAAAGSTLPHHHHDEMNIMQGNMNNVMMMSHVDHDDQWEAVRSIGYHPLISSLPAMSMGDIAWKPSMMPPPWDSSEMSTSFSTTTKCYT